MVDIFHCGPAALRSARLSMRWAQDPLFVGPVFLKKPSRVQALAYVLLIALLIFNLLEMVLTMTTDDPIRRAFGKRFKVPRVLKLAGFSPDIYLDVKDRSDHFT